MIHNEQDKLSNEFQPSDATILVLNEISHKTLWLEDDPLGLSGWSWVQLWGKYNHFLWLVALYQICISDGHLTTYQQHIRWLSTQQQMICPCQKILDNLQEQINIWQSEGDQVFVLAEINEDVWVGPIYSTFCCMGHVEALTTLHGMSSPNTHNCSQKNPINGMLIHPDLLPSICFGYLAFGEVIPSNIEHCEWTSL